MIRLRTVLTLGGLATLLLGTGLLAQAGAQSASSQRLPAARIVFKSWYRCLNNACSKPNYSIAVINPNGTGFHRLTHEDVEEASPAWSPDHRWIAFVKAGTLPGRIWVMDASGRHQRQLTPKPAYQYEPDWSPDGRRIVFTDETKDLWTVDVRTGRTARLTRTAATEWSPAWSPDGSKIAFASSRGGNGIQIWVFSLRTHRMRQLTRPARGADSQEPTWSPDARRIAFRRSGGVIYLMNADGSHVHPLPSGPAASHPSWSPDGRWIAFEQQPQGLLRMNIVVIRPDGTGRRNVTHARARWNNLNPDW